MLPAQAGMILLLYDGSAHAQRAPRASGDDPPTGTVSHDAPSCSPRKRG